MKKLISIAAVLMVLFVGCSNQENNVTGPTTCNESSFQKS